MKAKIIGKNSRIPTRNLKVGEKVDVVSFISVDEYNLPIAIVKIGKYLEAVEIWCLEIIEEKKGEKKMRVKLKEIFEYLFESLEELYSKNNISYDIYNNMFNMLTELENEIENIKRREIKRKF